MVSSALPERCCRVLTPSLGRVKFLYADARYRAVRSMCLRGLGNDKNSARLAQS
jgi:hypothetical protein